MSALDEVGAVADAVLFEGYLLYPYRASAQKNRLRWQFGVLTPASDGTEPTRNRTEVLLEPKPGSVLRIRLRFLQLQARTPLAGVAPDPRHFAFEEGVPRQVDAVVAVDDLLAGEHTIPIDLQASSEIDGPYRRECLPVRGRVLVSAVDLPGPYLVYRLRLDVVNDGECAAGAPREEVLRTSLIAAHTVWAAEPGVFLSMTDPPRWAKPYVEECVCEHTWPVLAGAPDRSDLLLSSPIILHDHPQLAPESTIDLFDGLENDEILTLRTLTLTDDEKAEARATDPRAAGIIDAVEAMPPEILERLHGAIRSLRPVGADSPAEQPPERLPWWDPAQDDTVDPDTDSVLVGGVSVAKGSRVVLRPGRGGDIQDQFLDGRSATVHAVLHDVDGGVHVAVSVDGDPAAEMQIAHGRFRYFRPDELEATSARARKPSPEQRFPRTRVLVAGIGNAFLSDDGFGVEVIARLRERELPPQVELVDTGIRGMHLAYQLLDGYDVLVIVDAVARGSDPGTLYILEHDLDTPADDAGPPPTTTGAGPAAAPAVGNAVALDPHGMDPAAVLAQLDGLASAMGLTRPVGRVLVVGCEPASLDEGMGLSAAVAAAVGPAVDTVVELVTSLPEGVRG